MWPTAPAHVAAVSTAACLCVHVCAPLLLPPLSLSPPATLYPLPARRIALVNWRTAKDAAKAAFHAQALALGDVDSSGISAPDGLVGSSTHTVTSFADRLAASGLAVICFVAVAGVARLGWFLEDFQPRLYACGGVQVVAESHSSTCSNGPLTVSSRC